MCPERSRLEGVDRPEPEEVLTGTPARTPDHVPSDDDREVVLDDPALPEGPVEDDDLGSE